MRKKFFSLLVLLAAVVTSAMAQEESLLTTLTFGESETYGETTSGVVNVTATNVGSYNGTYGWLLAEESSLSVTAKEGYTITKCVFRQNAKTPITDTEAPFEIHTNDWGGIIEDPYEEMNGVTSIEVYGYANAGGGSAATEVIITNNDFPEMDVSFTKDGVTVWADWIDNMNSGNLVGPGSFSTTLGNFTKIEVNAGEVLALGEGWSGNSERQTWTGNASSVSFSGEIYGVGHGITIICTIEPASTPEPQPAGQVITWDFNFCNEVTAMCDDGATIALDNSKDGISVTYGGYDDMDGWGGGYIYLYGASESKMIFSSTVGDISKIEIYYSDNIGGTPADWTLDATNNKFVWEGTPAASVDMKKGSADNIGFAVDHIVFTIAGSTPTAVENVQTNQVQATKFFRDGMLLIEKNGKIYNVQGVEVR